VLVAIISMRTFLIILYLGLFLLLCLAGTMDTVVYSQEGFLKWFPYLIIFIAQPVALYLLLSQFSFANSKIQSRLLIRGTIAISVLIISLTYIYYLQTKQENDLLLYGQTTKGVVYKKWYDTYKDKSKWLLKCKYVIDGDTLSTFSETDKENKYKVGDTLTILYSTRNPTNCIIQELKEK
jgi:hypothetical protein